MSEKHKDKPFFSRGNARVWWSNVPSWARYVTVSSSGYAWAWEERPDLVFTIGIGGWGYRDGRREIVAHVGAECPDWQDLIFERPAHVETHHPHITAAERDAIRVFLPGAVGVAKDGSGAVYAYVKTPRLFAMSESVNSCWLGDQVNTGYFRTAFLEQRFADVDPEQSWTPL